MKLRGVEFKPMWDASGVRGFAGEGYWHHRLPLVRDWLALKGSTFVGKTMTCDPNPGHMPLKGPCSFQPIERFPRCIWVDLVQQLTVNSVGLANPGADALFGCHVHRHDEPFQLSFMAIKRTREERLNEARRFITALLRRTKALIGPGLLQMGVQVNFTCPNTGHDPAQLQDEALDVLDAFLPVAELDIPIIPKINVLASPRMIREISRHPACDAICMSNAVPYDEMKKLAEQHGIRFRGPKESPLVRRNPKFGGGGYSGPELLELVIRTIDSAKDAGVTKPWNAGGGIRDADDVEELVRRASLERGKDSIFIASAAIVCPWNVPGIERAAHRLLG